MDASAPATPVSEPASNRGPDTPWSQRRRAGRARRSDPFHQSWDPVIVQLYAAAYDDLIRSAIRILRSTALAEDAVQESFIRYHTRAGDVAPGKELAYLRSIVCNVARSMLRRVEVERRHLPTEVRLAPSAEDCMIGRTSAEALREQVDELPARQRQVIALRHFDQRSMRETASLLAITEGSAKVHAHRGRAELRRRLVGDEPDHPAAA